jgi:hypothetical protein
MYERAHDGGGAVSWGGATDGGQEAASSAAITFATSGGESFALTATGRLSVTCNGYRAARSSVERGLSHVTSRSHSRDL